MGISLGPVVLIFYLPILIVSVSILPRVPKRSHYWLSPNEALHEGNVSKINFEKLISNTRDCNNASLETKSQFPNCHIKFDIVKKSFCFGPNTLITRTHENTMDIHILCTASFPIQIDARFQYGMPVLSSARVVYEREVQDYYNHTTYIYAIRIFPPIPDNLPMSKQIVKYYVRNKKDPMKETIVFLTSSGNHIIMINRCNFYCHSIVRYIF